MGVWKRPFGSSSSNPAPPPSSSTKHSNPEQPIGSSLQPHSLSGERLESKELPTPAVGLLIAALEMAPRRRQLILSARGMADGMGALQRQRR